MYRKNIETFLIIVLLAVDAALAFMLFRQRNIEVYDKDTVAEIQSIFGASGIEVADDILTEKTEDMKFCKSDAGGSNSPQKSIPSKLLRGEISETFIIPDGFVFFTSTGETLTVKSNSSFTYSYGISAIPDEKGTKIEDNNELKKWRQLLSEYFDTEESEENLGFTIDDISKTSSGTSVHITQTLDGVKITNNTLYCVFDSEKMIFADGTWCFLRISEKRTAHLFDRVNILFIEKGEIDKAAAKDESNTEEDNDDTQKLKIKSITQCYRAFCDIGTSSFSFIPSWIIEYESGDISYYNAINGEKE